MLQALDGSAPYATDVGECAIRTAPASTFKIPHALIALETGVVQDPLRTVAWDGSRQPFAAWERNHSLQSAVQWSVVWFFRRMAGLIGPERMRESLDALEYAADGFDGDVTSFWLNGDLVVSPAEQLDFLGRMVGYELPASRQHVDTVLEIIRMPSGQITNALGTHDFTIGWPGAPVVRAKTGSTTVGDERVGWLVGAIDAGGRTYVFVSRVRAAGAISSTASIDLARRVLSARVP